MKHTGRGNPERGDPCLFFVHSLTRCVTTLPRCVNCLPHCVRWVTRCVKGLPHKAIHCSAPSIPNERGNL